MLYYIILCYTILCYIMLYYIVLYYTYDQTSRYIYVDVQIL